MKYTEPVLEVEAEKEVPESVKFETQLISLIQEFATSNELKVSSIEVSWMRDEEHLEGSLVDRIYIDYKSTRKYGAL